jgi:UDP-glucose-4-epimerase GalE
MIVLVIGGAGYIGSHAAYALRAQGHEVIIYDNLSTGHRRLAQGFELIVGDLADRQQLATVLGRVDSVMHFAAHAYVGESVLDPRKYFTNNVVGGLSLLDAILESNVRKIVFSSSCAVYGTPQQIPISEDAPRSPLNPYGATKLAFEHALEAYDRAYGVRSVSFRYFNAAGCDEEGRTGEIHCPETHLIPSALESADGQRAQLEVFGDDLPTADGTCIRDYVHVSDLAEAHVLGLEYLERGQPSTSFNLGTGNGASVAEVIAMVEGVCGRRVPSRVCPRRQGDPAILVADPSRARDLLGWRPKRTLEEMVASAWSWHQNIHRHNTRATMRDTPLRHTSAASTI